MIFTVPVACCRVRAFASLVTARDTDTLPLQLTVLDFGVALENEQPTTMLIPVPLTAARLVSTYDAHLDHVQECFEEPGPGHVIESARAHRDRVTPVLLDTLRDDDLAPMRGAVEARYDPALFRFLRVDFQASTATHPIAYVHAARTDFRLFVPGASIADEHAVEFDHTVFTLNTLPDIAGVAPIASRFQTAFRWDLIAGVSFPNIESLHRLEHVGPHPNSDIVLPTERTPTDSRLYVAGDGTCFHDETRLRVVQFVPYGLRTFPLVNGAYLTTPGDTEPFHFGGTTCRFDERPDPEHPGAWAVLLNDDGDRMWIRPWRVRYEYGKAFVDMVPATPCAEAAQ